MPGYAYGVVTIRLIDAFYHDAWGGVVFLYLVAAVGLPRVVGCICIPCQEADAQWGADKMIEGQSHGPPPAVRWN